MIKAAAYCRVSTDKEDQINSLESQVSYFLSYTEKNPDIKIVKIYADEGLSGTSTKKRLEFMKMIEDAKLNKFSLILTKEVSRFARNTVDILNYTRELKSYGVGVRFLLDNILTTDLDGELRLSIMASIAQEESRKTSERVKWGQKRKMENGVVFGRSLLGYDVIDGKIYVNLKGAEIVKYIYKSFTEDKKTIKEIKSELERKNIKTFWGNDIWQEGVILKILKNEKYIGDLVQQKTETPDFLTHKKVKTKNPEKLIIIKNHHEPIIDREVFFLASELLKRKSKHNKKTDIPVSVR